jgi:hypothetical protein
MIHLHFPWWVWAAMVFTVLMIYKGPSEMVVLAADLLHAVDAAAGGMVKALHATEQCSTACRPG